MATKIPNVIADAGHMGRKIERIRLLRGMKQGALATALGVSQQAISKLEDSEEIDEEKLEKIAAALDVSVDAIKHFNEDAAVNQFNSFHNNEMAVGSIGTQVNTMDKVVALYDEMLTLERNKVAELTQRLQEMEAKMNEKK